VKLLRGQAACWQLTGPATASLAMLPYVSFSLHLHAQAIAIAAASALRSAPANKNTSLQGIATALKNTPSECQHSAGTSADAAELRCCPHVLCSAPQHCARMPNANCYQSFHTVVAGKPNL